MPYDDDTFMAGLAVYVVLEKEGKCFLLRRTNGRWKNGYYSLPAGRVEEGETFFDAAVREAHEEAGVKLIADKLHLYAVITRQENQDRHPDWVDLFFVAQNWEGEAHLHETGKFDQVGWFSPEEVEKIQLIENQKDGLGALPEFRRSGRIAHLHQRY